jgi:hypothetical protein
MALVLVLEDFRRNKHLAVDLEGQILQISTTRPPLP